MYREHGATLLLGAQSQSSDQTSTESLEGGG